MPGIVVIIDKTAVSTLQAPLAQMMAAMSTDGPYEQRTVLAPALGLAAGWVGLRDGHNGPGVYSDPQRDTVILLSGECFPAASGSGIRASTEGADHSMHWLLEEYNKVGEQCLRRSDGLFAGVLIDKREKKTLVFNDRYGMERVYFHEARDFFYFASEAKALLRVLPEVREFDEDGVADFLSLGFTTQWRTLFRNVHLMPGGSVWSIRNGTCVKSQYFARSEWEAQPLLTAESFERNLSETFPRILPRYLSEHSKLGIAVTAGLDTRMIMACLGTDEPAPVTYTFVGESGKPLDATIGRKIADVCRLRHHVIGLESDFFSDFASFADRTVFHTDGTFGVTGAHEIYFNARARELAPIRLTGNYGSEVLRRVSGFKRYTLAPGLLTPECRARMKGTDDEIRSGNSASFAAFQAVPWRLHGNYAANRSQLVLRTPYLDAELVALACQRPDDLRGSPSPATRLVNHGNPYLARIPTDMGFLGNAGRTRQALRYAWNRSWFKLDYYHTAGLPGRLSMFDPTLDYFGQRIPLFGKHKFLHYRRWFRTRLRDYVRERLLDSDTLAMPFWNAPVVGRIAEDHLAGRQNYETAIDAVITLATVKRLLLSFPSSERR